jgi:hypothetical protein
MDKVAIKRLDGKYVCGYCGKIFSKDQDADTCKQSHDLIYLALSVDDLNRLYSFLHSKNNDYLTESLFNQVAKAVRTVTTRNK